MQNCDRRSNVKPESSPLTSEIVADKIILNIRSNALVISLQFELSFQAQLLTFFSR